MRDAAVLERRQKIVVGQDQAQRVAHAARFNWDRCARETWDVYRLALEGQARQAA
jgi:hypothetical protein